MQSNFAIVATTLGITAVITVLVLHRSNCTTLEWDLGKDARIFAGSDSQRLVTKIVD